MPDPWSVVSIKPAGSMPPPPPPGNPPSGDPWAVVSHQPAQSYDPAKDTSLTDMMGHGLPTQEDLEGRTIPTSTPVSGNGKGYNPPAGENLQRAKNLPFQSGTSMSAGTKQYTPPIDPYAAAQPNTVKSFVSSAGLPTNQPETTTMVRGLLNPQADPNETSKLVRFEEQIPVLGSDFRARAELAKRGDNFNAAIPLFGPANAAFAEKAQQGDYTGAAGAALNALFSLEGMKAAVAPGIRTMTGAPNPEAMRPPATPDINQPARAPSGTGTYTRPPIDRPISTQPEAAPPRGITSQSSFVPDLKAKAGAVAKVAGQDLLAHVPVVGRVVQRPSFADYATAFKTKADPQLDLFNNTPKLGDSPLFSTAADPLTPASMKPEELAPAPYRLKGNQIQDATTVTPKPVFKPAGLLTEGTPEAAPAKPARGITQGKAPYVPGAVMEPAPFLTMHGAESGETAALMQLTHTGGQALRRIAQARGLKIPAAADNVSIIQKIHDDLSPEEVQSFADAAKSRAQERATSLEGVDPAIVSDNREIAQKLYDKADEMQAAGESPYKIRAWRTAGESIETRPTPVKDILGDTDALKTIRGVDSRMAQHIQEVTGSWQPPVTQAPPSPAGIPPQAAPAAAVPPRGITQVPAPPEAPRPQLATEANTEDLLQKSIAQAKAQRGITQPIDTSKKVQPLESGQTVEGNYGSATQVKTPSGNALPAKYKVVEADSLIPSHNAQTFAKNPQYPEGVQERAYHTSKEAQARVIQQAQNYDPAYTVNTNPDAVNGPPVVTKDGIVLGGNSRTMSTQRLYKAGGGDAYRADLTKNAVQFGVTPEQIAGMKNPVLVREVETPANIEEARRIGAELNKSMTGAMGISEKAVSAGRSVKPETLASISGMVNDMGEGATLRDALRQNGKDILAKMVNDGAISERERPQYVDTATGGLNEEGKTFVERALVGSVVDDPRLMDTVPKSVLGKLEGSLGDLATVGSRTDEYNLLPIVRDALAEHAEIASRGLDVNTHLSQTGMFGPPRNPAVDTMVRALAEKPKAFRAALKQYAQDAKYDAQGQGALSLGQQPSAAKAFNDAFGTNLTEDQFHDALLQSLTKEGTIGKGGQETPNPSAHASLRENATPIPQRGITAGITENQSRTAAASQSSAVGQSPPGKPPVPTSPPAGGFSVAPRNLPSDFRISAEESINGTDLAMKDAKGKSMGTVGIRSADLIPGKNVSEVGDIKLQPEYQGKGYGQALYEKAAAHARDAGDDYLVSSGSPTAAAKAAWQKLQAAHPGEITFSDGRFRWDLSGKQAPTVPRGITQPIDLNAPPEQRAMPPEVTARADRSGMKPGQTVPDQTATKPFKDWFGESKVVDEQGKPIRVFRGDYRGDKLGPSFKVNQTTSGRFYFTDDPEIASNYSTNKPDLKTVEEHYGQNFTFPELKYPRERTAPNLDQAWYRLSPEQKSAVKKTVENTTMDDQGEIKFDTGESIYPKDGLPWMEQQHRGNWLKVAQDIWLDSGNLFDREADFEKIMSKAGLRADYDSAHIARSAVTPVYLSIKNPLDTAAIPAEVVSKLDEVAKADRSRPAKYGVDQWDKTTITPKEWMAALHDDLDKGTTHAWTRVPEKITKALQSMGYDGIKDTGGKMGGAAHSVWIAFEPTQIKSAIGNKGTFNPKDPKIINDLRPPRGITAPPSFRGITSDNSMSA